jgi:very-short-patch-repair endonuclease
VGATEETFARLAGAAGVVFSRGVSPAWLTNRGHLSGAIADQLNAACDAALRSIYSALGGDETLLVRKRSGSDPRLDFVLADHTLAVEVDEIQHFTTERLRTLNLYPAAAELCFDTVAYRALIGRWCTTADRYRAAKSTVDFPFAGGRRAQRAYFDAFRDLAAPSFGLRVLRIPAPECDGRLAFERFMAAMTEFERRAANRSSS